jgi:hypothetical protein
VDSEELNVDMITDLLYKLIQERGQEYNLNISKATLRTIVEEIYETEFIMTYHVKNEYQNKGLYPTTLHNVVVMEF